jgi:acyl carrier protein
MMEIQNGLRQFLAEELQAAGDSLGDDSPLISSHVIDSLGLLQIVSYIENEYEVEVGDDEIVPDNFETIGSIAKLVESKLAQRSAR